MTPQEHNRLVGIFLMAHGGLQLLVMVFVGLIYGVLGAAFTIGGEGEQKMLGLVFIAMIAFVVLMSVIIAAPQLYGGYKMYKQKAGARTWGIVGSIISCLSFPIGTAAGVYGLWFLFGDEGKKFYLGGPVRNAFQPVEQPRPPQPGGWQ